MTEQEIVKMLDELAEIQARLDLLRLDKQKAIDDVLTPEIKQQLSDIEMEFMGVAEAGETRASELTNEIKDAVTKHGKTVKAEFMQAVYSKPRVTWDSKQLEGLMIAVPQLEQSRKVGKPSVSIRKV
jgi:phage host-nuclease inhibitor protein Gam